MTAFIYGVIITLSMNIYTLIAAISGLITVILGALSDHVLHLMPGTLAKAVFTTASRYQMWHTVVLLALGLYFQKINAPRLMKLSAGLFTLGIVLFSGCIYLNLFTGIHGFVYAVPFGGMSFILGWAILILAVSMNIKREK